MKGIIGVVLLAFLGLTYANEGCFQRGCSFRGKQYEEGRSLDIKFRCFLLVCFQGKWKFTKIDDLSCDRCHLKDDPHIHSFDHHLYHWHGLCNYSLAQPIKCHMDETYHPKCAVYADFERCNKRAACVQSTTYKIDEHTVVTIDHKTLIPNTLKINGKKFSPLPTTPSEVSDCHRNVYPAIVWKFKDCAYIVGKMFSIKACKSDLFIYTKKKNMKELVGLCGFYSGKKMDDYIPRGSCDHRPTSFANFARSWKTKDQIDHCNDAMEKEMYLRSIEIEKSCDKDKYYELCKRQVLAGHTQCEKHKDDIHEARIQGDIENCVLDCCANPHAHEIWVSNAGIMANVSCETKLMEKGVIL